MSSLRMEDKNILEHYTDLSVGEVFRRARNAYGLSVQDVSHRTLIRMDVLEAIENNDRERLPSRVYALGFVKNYADFLGLDANKMIYLFKIQVIGEDPAGKNKNKNRSLADGMSSGMPIGMIIVVAVGGFLVIASMVYAAFKLTGPSTQDVMNAEHSIPALSQMMRPDMTVNDAESIDAWKRLDMTTITGEQGLAGIVLPEGGGAAYGEAWQRSGIVLKAMQTVWVKISSAKGELLLNRVLQGGDVVHMDAAQSYILETTFADALDAYDGGLRIGRFSGGEKDMKEFILSREALPSLLADERPEHEKNSAPVPPVTQPPAQTAPQEPVQDPAQDPAVSE